MQRARTDDEKDKRRSALLDAALDEFFERGFNAARLDDIARRAGLSKGAVYLYFSSKEDLFTSLVNLHAAPKVDRLVALTDQAPSFIEGLNTLAGAAPLIIRQSKMPRLLKILVGDAPQFPDSVRLYRERVIDRMLGAVTRLVQRGCDAGEIYVEAPELAARLIVAPVVMSAIWQVAFEASDRGATIDLDAFFAQHNKLIIRALTRANTDQGNV